MDSAKILGYFIEETKEHLETLQTGILDLPSVIEDEERINEMFRAAHSVKGGAAMLNYSSIQKTAHKLEDCFKILQEQPVKADQKLVSLFLKVYDTLNELVERLQSPYGLRPEDGNKLVQDAEPTFVQLEKYLHHLLDGGAPAAPSEPVAAPSQGVSKNFAAQSTGILKQMLDLFKQKETPANRQQLANLCANLIDLGTGVETWQRMVNTVQKAVNNPQNSYRNLAPVVIKELKQATELMVAGKANAIAVSKPLNDFAVTPEPVAASTPAKAVAVAPTSPPKPKQITIEVEPRAAAKALVQSFNRQQLTQLVQLLQKILTK